MKEPTSESEQVKQVRKRLMIVIIINVMILAGGALLYLLYDNTGNGVECRIYRLTGCYCPSCGVTRMMYSLIRDHDLWQAFRYNPMLFYSMPMLVVLYVQQSVVFVRTGGLSDWMADFAKVWGFLMVLFCILRNIPAFDFLAPTAL